MEAKHEFVDDYPYIVYSSQDTIVYSDKTDTSIDDVSGGGATWGSYTEVALITEDSQIDIMLLQSPFDTENPPDTYIGFTLFATTCFVPSGMNCAIPSNGATLAFEIDNEPFTDYTVNEFGLYCFEMPAGEEFSIAISS